MGRLGSVAFVFSLQGDRSPRGKVLCPDPNAMPMLENPGADIVAVELERQQKQLQLHEQKLQEQQEQNMREREQEQNLREHEQEQKMRAEERKVAVTQTTPNIDDSFRGPFVGGEIPERQRPAMVGSGSFVLYDSPASRSVAEILQNELSQRDDVRNVHQRELHRAETAPMSRSEPRAHRREIPHTRQPPMPLEAESAPLRNDVSAQESLREPLRHSKHAQAHRGSPNQVRHSEPAHKRHSQPAHIRQAETADVRRSEPRAIRHAEQARMHREPTQQCRSEPSHTQPDRRHYHPEDPHMRRSEPAQLCHSAQTRVQARRTEQAHIHLRSDSPQMRRSEPARRHQADPTELHRSEPSRQRQPQSAERHHPSARAQARKSDVAHTRMSEPARAHAQRSVAGEHARKRHTAPNMHHDAMKGNPKHRSSGSTHVPSGAEPDYSSSPSQNVSRSAGARDREVEYTTQRDVTQEDQDGAERYDGIQDSSLLRELSSEAWEETGATPQGRHDSGYHLEEQHDTMGYGTPPTASAASHARKDTHLPASPAASPQLSRAHSSVPARRSDPPRHRTDRGRRPASAHYGSRRSAQTQPGQVGNRRVRHTAQPQLNSAGAADTGVHRSSKPLGQMHASQSRSTHVLDDSALPTPDSIPYGASLFAPQSQSRASTRAAWRSEKTFSPPARTLERKPGTPPSHSAVALGKGPIRAATAPHLKTSPTDAKRRASTGDRAKRSKADSYLELSRQGSKKKSEVAHKEEIAEREPSVASLSEKEEDLRTVTQPSAQTTKRTHTEKADSGDWWQEIRKSVAKKESSDDMGQILNCLEKIHCSLASAHELGERRHEKVEERLSQQEEKQSQLEEELAASMYRNSVDLNSLVSHIKRVTEQGSIQPSVPALMDKEQPKPKVSKPHRSTSSLPVEEKIHALQKANSSLRKSLNAEKHLESQVSALSTFNDAATSAKKSRTHVSKKSQRESHSAKKETQSAKKTSAKKMESQSTSSSASNFFEHSRSPTPEASPSPMGHGSEFDNFLDSVSLPSEVPPRCASKASRRSRNSKNSADEMISSMTPTYSSNLLLSSDISFVGSDSGPPKLRSVAEATNIPDLVTQIPSGASSVRESVTLSSTAGSTHNPFYNSGFAWQRQHWREVHSIGSVEIPQSRLRKQNSSVSPPRESHLPVTTDLVRPSSSSKALPAWSSGYWDENGTFRKRDEAASATPRSEDHFEVTQPPVARDVAELPPGEEADVIDEILDAVPRDESRVEDGGRACADEECREEDRAYDDGRVNANADIGENSIDRTGSRRHEEDSREEDGMRHDNRSDDNRSQDDRRYDDRSRDDRRYDDDRYEDDRRYDDDRYEDDRRYDDDRSRDDRRYDDDRSRDDRRYDDDRSRDDRRNDDGRSRDDRRYDDDRYEDDRRYDDDRSRDDRRYDDDRSWDDRRYDDDRSRDDRRYDDDRSRDDRRYDDDRYEGDRRYDDDRSRDDRRYDDDRYEGDRRYDDDRSRDDRRYDDDRSRDDRRYDDDRTPDDRRYDDRYQDDAWAYDDRSRDDARADDRSRDDMRYDDRIQDDRLPVHDDSDDRQNDHEPPLPVGYSEDSIALEMARYAETSTPAIEDGSSHYEHPKQSDPPRQETGEDGASVRERDTSRKSSRAERRALATQSTWRSSPTSTDSDMPTSAPHAFRAYIPTKDGSSTSDSDEESMAAADTLRELGFSD